MTDNQPVKKFKAGAVSVSIFENGATTKEGKAIMFHSIALQRTYKDKDGKWQNTNSMRTADLPNAILVLQMSFESLVMKQQNGQATDDAVLEETL